MLNKDLFFRFLSSRRFSVQEKAVAIEAVWSLLQDEKLDDIFMVERDAKRLLFLLSRDEVKISFFNRLYEKYFFKLTEDEILSLILSFGKGELRSVQGLVTSKHKSNDLELALFFKNVNLPIHLNSAIGL